MAFKVFEPAVDYNIFFEDFFQYAATDWVITTTEDGAGSATEAVSATRGGNLVITNDDADDDHDFLQHSLDGGTTPAEVWKFVTGKEMYFAARFKVSDADACDVVMGLQDTDTSPLDVDDGIFFQIVDGSTDLNFHCEKSDTQSSLTGIHTMVDDTFVEVEWYYDGSNASIQVFVDGEEAGSVPLTNAPDDEELAVSFGIQNGAAAAKVLTVDYIYVAQKR